MTEHKNCTNCVWGEPSKGLWACGQPDEGEFLCELSPDEDIDCDDWEYKKPTIIKTDEYTTYVVIFTMQHHFPYDPLDIRTVEKHFETEGEAIDYATMIRLSEGKTYKELSGVPEWAKMSASYCYLFNSNSKSYSDWCNDFKLIGLEKRETSRTIIDIMDGINES